MGTGQGGLLGAGGAAGETGSILVPTWLATLLLGLLLLSLLVFLVRFVLHGRPLAPGTGLPARGPGPLLRAWFFWVSRPLWLVISWAKLPANAVNTLAALLGLAAAVAAGSGSFSLAGWLLLTSDALSAVDLRVHRVRSAGAVLGTLMVRLADGAVLIGLAFFYRSTWVLLPVLLAFLGSFLAPYVRARGEGLGVALPSGGFPRPVRALLLGLCLAASPPLEVVLPSGGVVPPNWPVVVGILLVALSSLVATVARAIVLVRRLQGGGPPEKKKEKGQRGLAALLGWHSVAGAVATGCDYATVLTLVSWLGLSPVLATAIGVTVGGLINYTFNRFITFRSSRTMGPELVRYTAVNALALGFNTGGLALVLRLPGLPYQVGWWLVRGAVYLLWNFPLQKNYVFATKGETPEPPGRQWPGRAERAAPPGAGT